MTPDRTLRVISLSILSLPLPSRSLAPAQPGPAAAASARSNGGSCQVSLSSLRYEGSYSTASLSITGMEAPDLSTLSGTLGASAEISRMGGKK